MTVGWVAIADIRGVQGFIFETDRLAQMRGASYLLDALTTPVERITNDCDGTLVVKKGGRFEATFENRLRADRWKGLVLTAFRSATGLDSSRISFGSGPDAEQANRSLSDAKRETAPPAFVTHSLLSPCAWCGVRAAVAVDGDDLICQVCRARANGSTKAMTGLWDELSLEGRPTADLGGFAAGSKPRGRIALIVADGNDIGALMREATDKRAMSDRLSAATTVAVRRAAGCAGAGGLLPLWVGGDDAVLAVHAHRGLDAAVAFVREFQAEMARAGAEDPSPVTMSAAVVIVRASHPFLESHALAHELLDNVKAAVRSKAWAAGVGGLDVEVVNESVTGTLERRRSGSGHRPLAATTPPRDWGIDDAREHARRLIERRAPRSRVYQLRDDGPLPTFADPDVEQVVTAARKMRRLDTLRVLFELERDGGGQ